MTLKSIDNWINLGLFLGMEHSTLKKIERDERGQVEDCKREMLVEWLKSSEEPRTKQQLIKAVYQMSSPLLTAKPHM